MEKFANANSDFALNLFKTIASEEKNAFLSPVSITAALGMVFSGADGNTKVEMNHVLFNGLNDQEIHDGSQNMINVINKPVDGYTLKTANRIHIEKSFEVLQSYTDEVKKYFHSECISSDFKCNGEAVRVEINNWVENMTNQKIRNLIPPRVFDKTRLILVNAIYFKGDWNEKFDETLTEKKPFFKNSQNSVNLDMMRSKRDYDYAENDKCLILGMPYKSKELMMFFVLPQKRNALLEVENDITGSDLIKLFRNTRSSEVEVELPKFKLEESFELSDSFKKLGCNDMFGGDADFSKISGSKDLWVSSIIHKAFIEVNEKGAEAAAATAVVMTEFLSMPIPKKQNRFIADHPFLFAIVEKQTMTILFLGHFFG